MTAWGSAGGALAGAIYTLIIFAISGSSYLAPVGAIVGFVVGGITGLVLGFVEGLVLAAVVDSASHRFASRTAYRTFVYATNLLLTFIGTIVAFVAFTAAIGAANSTGYLIYTLIPTAIALVVACAASNHVVHQVEKTRTSAWVLAAGVALTRVDGED